MDALAGAFFFAAVEAVVFVKVVRGAVRAPRLTGDGGRTAARAIVAGEGQWVSVARAVLWCWGGLPLSYVVCRVMKFNIAKLLKHS